jgi:hypothetical protein
VRSQPAAHPPPGEQESTSKEFRHINVEEDREAQRLFERWLPVAAFDAANRRLARTEQPCNLGLRKGAMLAVTAEIVW